MVISLNFDQLVKFSTIHSYVLIYLIMVLEGPTITTAAAFAASLGYLNIVLIFFLSLVADINGDVLYYTLGHVGRHKIVDKYDTFFGIKKSTIQRTEKLFHKNFGKTMFLIKFSPLAPADLLAAGASKIPIKKFIWFSFIITLPRTIFFTSLGYFFGSAVNKILHYFALSQYVFLFIIVIVIVIYFIQKKISKIFTEKYNEN